MKNIKPFTLYEFNESDPFDEEVWGDERLYEYDFDLQIREPIIIPRLRDSYVLHIQNMHGDGDAFTDSTTYFNNIDELKDFLSFFHWVKDNRIRERQMRDVFEEYFPNREIYDFVDSDATTSLEYLCQIRDIKVTYIDNAGVEKRVEITKNRIR